LCLRWAAEVAAWPASEISGEAASKALLEGRDRHVRATRQLPSFDNLKAEVLGAMQAPADGFNVAVYFELRRACG